MIYSLDNMNNFEISQKPISIINGGSDELVIIRENKNLKLLFVAVYYPFPLDSLRNITFYGYSLNRSSIGGCIVTFSIPTRNPTMEDENDKIITHNSGKIILLMIYIISTVLLLWDFNLRKRYSKQHFHRQLR